MGGTSGCNSCVPRACCPPPCCKEKKKPRCDCRSFAEVVAPKCQCDCKPIPGPCAVVRPCQCGELQVIKCDIDCDRTLSGLVLIADEVHVRKGARLTIEPNSFVFFKNGPLDNVDAGQLPFAALVIDSGASIVANDVDFKNVEDVANNTGGLIIVGTNQASIAQFGEVYQPGTYDSVVAEADKKPQRSTLRNVRFTNLGNDQAQLSALTLFQVRDGEAEVKVRGQLYVNNSGGNALELVGGTRSIANLSVNGALGAGVSLDYSAVLTVTEKLVITSAVQSAAVSLCGAVGSINRLTVAIGAYFTARADGIVREPGACNYLRNGVFAGPTLITDPLYWSGPITNLTDISASHP